jgi:adenine-specific DNA-methyltransferase
MTSLAERERLKGQVQMIYIDPPYGIKFGSNWQVSTRKRDVKDGKVDDLTRQPEQVKAYRDTWELGIHSYLTYLRDRLTAARDLLTESGSVFVQIGDENVHLVRCLLDEVFGSEDFCAQLHFKSTTSQTSTLLAAVGDYILWYGKNHEQIKYRQIYVEKAASEPTAVLKYAEFNDGSRKTLTSEEQDGFATVAGQPRLFVLDNLTSQSGGDTTKIPVEFNGAKYSAGPGFWKTNSVGMERLKKAARLGISGKTLRYVRFVTDFPVTPLNSLWTDTSTGSFTDPKIYAVQTNTKVIQRCLLMTTDPGDLVIDPTCGSGTTAYVAEQWGRRWITIDTSRVALALTRTRLMSARYPYYILADSPDGLKKEAEITGQMIADRQTTDDLRQGFVYKRVPHITLKSIANNEEIDTIHAKWQPQLDASRAQLNAAFNQSWEEWQVPRELPIGNLNSEIKNLHAEWWQLRRERQREIDASIARRADTELLYDQPYEDNRRVRVSGPFTVESLSPHRVLPAEEERPQSEVEVQQEASGHFTTTIIDNLRKASKTPSATNALDLTVWNHSPEAGCMPPVNTPTRLETAAASQSRLVPSTARSDQNR